MNNFFATNLKYLRECHGMSKTDLSKKLNVHQSTISRWENETMGATVDNAYDISEIFNVPMSELLGKDLRVSENKKDDFSELDKVLFSKAKDLTDDDKRFIIDLMQKINKEIDEEQNK